MDSRHDSGNAGSYTPIRVICGWCGRLMKSGDEAGVTSHGICDGCTRAFESAQRPTRADTNRR